MSRAIESYTRHIRRSSATMSLCAPCVIKAGLGAAILLMSCIASVEAAAPAPVVGRWTASMFFDGPGQYSSNSNLFLLHEFLNDAAPEISFNFGSCASSCIGLMGDWSGDGIDTVGVYEPSINEFRLRNSNTTGAPDITFKFGTCGPSGCLPVVGDWDGDGITTVGLYNPLTNQFQLRNSNTAGTADYTFSYASCSGNDCLPIAGRWIASSTFDATGFYNPATNQFFLRDTLSTGAADTTITFGLCGHNCAPVAGDWNGGGADTIGLYDLGTHKFFLRGFNSPGPPSYEFFFNAIYIDGFEHTVTGG